jgi:hypothetical protein
MWRVRCDCGRVDTVRTSAIKTKRQCRACAGVLNYRAAQERAGHAFA